jgi:AcrR family transcriptional regulator
MDARLQQRPGEAPKDARQLRSRGALAAALLELLGEKPFDSVTIREVTARAGTGYATFFRNYPDKDALLADIASEEIAGLIARLAPLISAKGSAETTQAFCTHIDGQRRLWSALLTGGAGAIVRGEFIRQARLLARSMPRPDSWLPADLGVVHGTGATIDLLAWWLKQETDYSAEQIAAILDRLIIAPLVGDLAKRQAGQPV